MWLLPIAVAEVQHACRSGRRLWLAAALLAATLLSHTLYGYMAALSSLALVWVGRGGIRLALRGARLALIFLLAGLATAYFVVPRALDSLWLNRSVFEPAWKYDSFGHRQVLPQLFRGELLDAGRFPTLTLLMFVGLAVALLERRREQRFAVVLLLLWVSLYFGRATWGPLFDWLPASSEIHAHRFIAGVHMAALPLIGLGLQRFVAALVRYVSTSRGRRFALAGGLVALTLWPAARERRAYLGRNGAVLRQTATAVEAVQPDLDGLVATLRALQAKRPGRVYAGLPRGWGGAFRVGEVPMYSLLSLQRLDMLGHAYHTLSLAADVQYLFDENDPRHYDLFGVGYVVAPEGHPRPSFWQPLWRYGTWMLYSVPGSGFVSPVYAPAVLDGTKSGFFDAASRWLQRGDFGTGPACGTVSEQSFDGARYTVAASATTPCHLRFKTSFHPGWRATVDGRPSPTVPLMPGFTGVLLEPGTHHVTLEYRATPGRVWMAAAGLLVLALAARAGRRLTRVVDRAALRPASLVL
jgi:hypothetical protein